MLPDERNTITFELLHWLSSSQSYFTVELLGPYKKKPKVQMRDAEKIEVVSSRIVTERNAAKRLAYGGLWCLRFKAGLW